MKILSIIICPLLLLTTIHKQNPQPAPKTAARPYTGDRRLDLPVKIDSRLTQVRFVASTIAKATGCKLLVQDDLASTPCALMIRERPASEIMDAMAVLTRAGWHRTSSAFVLAISPENAEYLCLPEDVRTQRFTDASRGLWRYINEELRKRLVAGAILKMEDMPRETHSFFLEIGRYCRFLDPDSVGPDALFGRGIVLRYNKAQDHIAVVLPNESGFPSEEMIQRPLSSFR